MGDTDIHSAIHFLSRKLQSSFDIGRKICYKNEFLTPGNLDVRVHSKNITLDLFWWSCRSLCPSSGMAPVVCDMRCFCIFAYVCTWLIYVYNSTVKLGEIKAKCYYESLVATKRSRLDVRIITCAFRQTLLLRDSLSVFHVYCFKNVIIILTKFEFTWFWMFLQNFKISFFTSEKF